MSEENDTHLDLFPDNDTCFPIPNGTGRRIRLIFPLINRTESCVCPITANKPNSREYFTMCSCINCTNIEFNFSSDNESICVTNVNVNSSLNHSLILFEDEDPLQQPDQTYYVHNILSTYRIIIPGEDAGQ